ncbi:MAG: hypothetical protein AAFO69_11040 [Bacteroidota bacterium]
MILTKFHRPAGAKILLLALLLLVTTGLATLHAQSYEHSAGVRLGHTSGLTYKKFLVEEQAIELLLSGRNEGIQLTVNYVKHSQMEFAFDENFYVYYGIGAHVGMERFNDLEKTIVPAPDGSISAVTFEDQNYFAMGIDGILGLEYRWLSVPITLSFDIKPYFNFIGMRYTETRFWDAGFSFKYVF